MSPDELHELRIHQLERAVEKLQGRGELETVDAAVQSSRLDDHGEQIRALWDEAKSLRRLLIGAMLTVTTGAIGTAFLVVTRVGGA